MRSLIACCVAGAMQIAAVTAAAAMKPVLLSSGTLTVLAQAEQAKRARGGVSDQQVLQNPFVQQMLRDPDLQQQIMNDPRFESMMQDPQVQRLMQNPQLQRQLQQNQQLRQMYQLQHRPLPGVSADDDD